MDHDLRAEIFRLVDSELPDDWREPTLTALRPMTKVIELVVALGKALGEEREKGADLRAELLKMEELRRENEALTHFRDSLIDRIRKERSHV
jgi:hypothetical protein